MSMPAKRYANDPSYHQCVDTLETLLHKAHFSPSEMREMAVLACIHYEQCRPPRSYVTAELAEALLKETEPARRGVVYLACPYSHPDAAVRQARFEAVNRFAAELFRSGELVFSPISHTHPIGEHGLPSDWDFWQWADRPLLELCDRMIVLCLDGWTESVGVTAEVDYYKAAGKPIEYRLPGTVADANPG